MPDAPRLAFIVSHTHWDREWYLPFSRFRVMLLRTVEGVIEALEHDDAYRHFCLDGQSVILEDVLEARPDLEPRLRALAASGALALGPWYVLPDEFLIPPEATVRNLLIGQRAAAPIGDVQKVGYAPDAFGHIAQMPQILRRAGIDSFVYTRGNADEIDDLGLEWTWRAPDGSEVLALQQERGYCNACALGYEEMWHAHTKREVDPDRAVEQIKALFEAMGATSNGDVWLLHNGCDHFPVQRDFGIILERLREAFPDTEFRHGSLRDTVDAVRASGVEAPVFEGELRGGRLHHVLSGVWSARMPLKQANDAAHTLLADVVEPMLACGRFLHGRPYPQGLLEATWKELLKNQPHDSICGCSVDEVHREMEPRFDRVLQTCEQAAMDALQAQAPSFGPGPDEDRDTVLCLFHPRPERRRAVIERLVVLQPFEGLDLDALRLVDDAGDVVPFEVIWRHRVRRFWGIDWRLTLDAESQVRQFTEYALQFGERFLEPAAEEGDLVDTFVKVRALVDLPPTGFTRLRLLEAADAAVPEIPAADAVHVREDRLSNEHVTVHLHPDGTFDLLDKRTGQRFRGLNVLEDVEDVGDEYDYSPASESQTVTSRDREGAVEVLDDGSLRGTLATRFVLPLPVSITPERTRRATECVDCPVEVRVSLDVDSPVVDVDVLFDNGAEDHRLGARFPTGADTDTVVSDAHFLLAERPVNPPDGERWVQPPPDTVPQQAFSFVQGGPRGLAVLNRGLPEIAALRGEDATVDLRLTLLRSVGWLSRDDFPTRRHQNAGPTVPTPDAQCIGSHRFRYAVMPVPEGMPAEEVTALSGRWRTPVPCVQGVLAGSRPGDDTGLVSLASGRTAVTAVKRHEERDTLIVRLVNLTGDPLEETLVLGFGVREAFTVDLLEEREGKASVEGRTVAARLGPHEIRTLEIVAAGVHVP